MELAGSFTEAKPVLLKVPPTASILEKIKRVRVEGMEKKSGQPAGPSIGLIKPFSRFAFQGKSKTRPRRREMEARAEKGGQPGHHR